MKFEEFGLNEQLIEALSYMGIENATPIQQKTIPEILNGRDIIASAQTGTGKTAAFLLPVLHKLEKTTRKGLNTLIIVPTRELAIQIEQQIQGFGYFMSVKSLAIYGGGEGSEWDYQKSALTNGADIIVATPGKLISHLNLGYVKFDQIEHLILDEADRMLDMGFIDDIRKIMSFIPEKRQTLMFSATMPPEIKKLVSQILKEPYEISISLSKPAENILQAAYLVNEPQKTRLINSLISGKENYTTILIFCSTKLKVMEIVRSLNGNGYKVEGISSDLEQKEREDVLQRFVSRKTRVLVATDVLSRGIDIKDIDLIINYDVPRDAEDYVHRVGRTARAEKSGVALTLVKEDEMYNFHRIENLIESTIIKISLPSELGVAPEWNPRPVRNGRIYGNRKVSRMNGNNKGKFN